VARPSVRHTLPLALALAACATWIGCSGKPAAEPEPVVDVQAATVARKTIQDVVSADAVLYARGEATIVPKISAPIEKFYVNRGSPVRAGQLLAKLENKDLTAAADEAKGAYEEAQAAYTTSTEVSLPQEIQTARLAVVATRQAMQAQQAVYESRQKLYKSGAIARNLLDESHVTYTEARNQYLLASTRLRRLEAVGQKQSLRSAQGQLASAKGRYLAALANLQYSEIRSPITGVVTDRPLYEGQMATAGTPLMTVMDLAHVIARAYISPQQAAQLHVGDPATLVPGGGEAEVPGKVTVVSPALDPNSTTVQVWVEAANPGDKLKPGSTVRVNMVARTIKDVLVVPAAAVLTADDGTTSVMVIGPEQHAHQTTVTTGVQSGGEVQILSGVSAGQRVVTTGAFGLPDGTKVRVGAAAAPAAHD
jgi:RND family efflux transporter MFP subunit